MLKEKSGLYTDSFWKVISKLSEYHAAKKFIYWGAMGHATQFMVKCDSWWGVWARKYQPDL